MTRLLAGQGVERTDVAKNGSGTLALSGVSQLLVAANKDRVGLWVGNTSAANKMFLSLSGAAATVNSGVMVPLGQSVFLAGYSGAVQIIGTAADNCAFAEI